MNQEGLYEAIFRRKSVRKYDSAALSEEVLSNITSYIQSLPSPFGGIQTEVRIVPASRVKGFIQVKAPHCVVAFSEVKPGYLVNIGFLLEKIALFLTAKGLGSCWQGWPKPTQELRDNRNLEFVIALAFGEPRENVHRNSVNEFRRKPLNDIRSATGFDDLIEAARLAPYGTSESWYFTGGGDLLHVHSAKQGFFKLASIEKLYQINGGIALSHLCVAADHFGRSVEFIEGQQSAPMPPKGYEHTASLRLL